MTMGETIKHNRLKLGLSQQELGEMVGVNKAAVQKWESGTVKNIKRSTIQKLADIFRITPTTLLGMEEHFSETSKNINYEAIDNIYPIKLKKFPLLGKIACGEPIFAEENHESYIMASNDIKADFCLVAKGDSMTGARINDGDVVFIRKQPMVDNGEIAAVIIDDEATLKRWYYYPDKQKLVLTPENNKYEPFVYVGEELNEIRCLGKAVCFMSNL